MPRKRKPWSTPAVDWPLPPRAALMTDPDMPCSTTADGRNPWPRIMAERAAAGEILPPWWQAAVDALRAGEATEPAEPSAETDPFYAELEEIY